MTNKIRRWKNIRLNCKICPLILSITLNRSPYFLIHYLSLTIIKIHYLNCDFVYIMEGPRLIPGSLCEDHVVGLMRVKTMKSTRDDIKRILGISVDNVAER